MLLFDFSLGVGAFGKGLSQISSFLSMYTHISVPCLQFQVLICVDTKKSIISTMYT